jgi:hypothetical protein
VDPNSGIPTFTGFVHTIPDSTSNPVIPTIKNTALNLWEDLGLEQAYDFSNVPGGTLYVTATIQILPTDNTTQVQDNQVLIDAVQVTQTAEQRPLLEGNGGVRLFQAGNDYLARYSVPAATLDANLLDLAAIDGTLYAEQEFRLGGPVRVLDPEIGVDALTRITGWERDLLRRTNSRVDISNAPANVTGFLAERPNQPARGRR